jgi:hypothetical protein
MQMKYVIFGLVAVAVVAGLTSTFLRKDVEMIACPMDAYLCANGSYVGRSGPSCEFQCPATTTLSIETQEALLAKADLITLTTPVPEMVMGNPVTITGAARGQWYFEASFPVVLTNWDGLIIAETFATAQGDWMTEDFVPFVAELGFENPYKEGDPDFMKRGSLILQKSNASGLPEHDDALEIPIRFAP